MDGRALDVGHVVAGVPERIAVEHEVAGIQPHLHGAGHALYIAAADGLGLLGVQVRHVGVRYRPVGKAADLPRRVAPQVAARHGPQAAVVVQSHVALVEQPRVVQQALPLPQIHPRVQVAVVAVPAHAVRRLARLVKDAQPFARQRQVDHHARLGGEQLTQRAVEHRQPVELVERPHVELGILDDRLQSLRIAAGHAARDRPTEVSLAPQLGQQRRRDQVAEDRVAQGVVIDDVLVVELEGHEGSRAPGLKPGRWPDAGRA